MKSKHLLFILSLSLVAVCSYSYFLAGDNTNELNIEELRAQHQAFLKNSPFNETKDLTRDERKALALPPNAYNERNWELTMDPSTGRPMPERLEEVQVALLEERQNNTRGVGGDIDNPWINRGPNNVGGRTKGVMFDPNDSNNERVFAGGVSGGLWVNQDITDSSSSWSLVAGVPSNVRVSVIISDPNNSNTFYMGTGESYTSGQGIGDGIWKSTDAGVTWTNIFGGYTGMVNGASFVDGIFYINDIVARDIGATTELYATIAGGFYSLSGPSQFHGLFEQGLYKSVNNGTSWTKFTLNETNGAPKNFQDLELDISNNIWVTSTLNSWGFTGGEVFRSTDGITFTNLGVIAADARRIEIEPDPSDADTMWAIANVVGATQAADLFEITYVGPGMTVAAMANEPEDDDNGIPDTDFTRGQAWYDVAIESDASGNLLVGGIDLFRSTDQGATAWTQISKWSNNADLNLLTASLVHADQHSITYRPGTGNENKVVFGTDGGLFYSDDITMAGGSSTNITSRNKDYVTLQIYNGTIDQLDGGDGDDIGGGTQDNGTQFTLDASAGLNAFFDPPGGDGGYTEIDNASGYAIGTLPRNNSRHNAYPSLPSWPAGYYITSGSGGDFINQAALDKNLDILYSNASTSTPTYVIEVNATFTGGPGGITRTTLVGTVGNNFQAPPTAFKVSPFTLASTTLFVGLEDGVLLRIDNADGGVAPTFNWINSPTPFAGSISDIEFGASESEIFVTLFNYGVTSIWYTSNGGTSWASKEGDLPDIPVRCILQNPLLPGEVIIGTELGVWSTLDYTVGSPTWTQAYNGMSDVAITDLDLRTSDNVILASTFGRGFFTSQFTATLGVGENGFDNSTVTINPTISDGEFTVRTKRALGEISFQIFSMTGQKVYDSNFELNDSNKKFNLDLSSGTYLVKMFNSEHQITKRIIIK